MPHFTFIHGMDNKPPAETLLNDWLWALEDEEGINCVNEDISTSLVYWADVLYDAPSQTARIHEAALELEALRAHAEHDLLPEGSWRESLGPEERAFVDLVAAELGVDATEEEAAAARAAEDAGAPAVSATPRLEAGEARAAAQLERIPLPWGLKRRLMRAFLRDVHHYLFNTRHSPRPGVAYTVRDEIRRRTLTALQEASSRPGPHVVVSHSMGTVVAYDCLKRIPECPPVDALVTIGSPLGIDEIQDRLKPEWSRNDGFPGRTLRGTWLNVFDRLDPVAGLDPFIGNDYRSGGRSVVVDLAEPNYGRWRHDIEKYLRGPRLRKHLRALAGL